MFVTMRWVIIIFFFCTELYAVPPAHVVLVLGDSISSAYGIAPQKGWVALARQHAISENIQWINASVSGETTAGGLERLPALLKLHSPTLVIIELGANDGLRGYSIEHMRRNLAHMIELIKKASAQPILLGMKIPPNYGKRYANHFHNSYQLLAKRYDIPWHPFFLAEVIQRPHWMQADGIHPNTQAQAQLLDHVLSLLIPVLKN